MERGIVSLVPSPGPLHVRVAPGRDGSFELYDGSTLTLSGDGKGSFEVTYTPGKAFTSGIVLEAVGVDTPSSVEVDGSKANSVADETAFRTCVAPCWRWDPKRRMLHVNAGGKGRKVSVR